MKVFVLALLFIAALVVSGANACTDDYECQMTGMYSGTPYSGWCDRWVTGVCQGLPECNYNTVCDGSEDFDTCQDCPPPAPVNGGWTAETCSWSACSVAGQQTETCTRTCTNPAPAYGGTSCTGSSSRIAGTQTCTPEPPPECGGQGQAPDPINNCCSGLRLDMSGTYCTSCCDPLNDNACPGYCTETNDACASGGGGSCNIGYSGPNCGDGTCNGVETAATCAADCTPASPAGSCCDNNGDCGGGQCISGTQNGVGTCNSQGSSGVCAGPCGSGEELWFDDSTGQTTCVEICPYYEPGGAQYLPGGACVYIGSGCRGDGLGYCGTGEVCCGAPGGKASDEGVCEPVPFTAAPFRPNDYTCSWYEESTGGVYQCIGGNGLQVSYDRSACLQNTLGQDTGLRDSIRTETVNLVSGQQPTHYIYSQFEQQIIWEGGTTYCDEYTLSSASCPSGWQTTDASTIILGACDEPVGPAGVSSPIEGLRVSCRKLVPTPEAPAAQPFTAYGGNSDASVCQAFDDQWPAIFGGVNVYAECPTGYTAGQQLPSSQASVTCWWGFWGSYNEYPVQATIYSTTCTPMPSPPSCGNWVCAFDESSNPADANYCEADCTQTTETRLALCPQFTAWDPAAGRCMEAQCGEYANTIGDKCADLTAPAMANYYCSQGYNSQLVESYCCPVGTYFEAGVGCQPTEECIDTSSATNYCGTAALNFPTNLASFLPRMQCIGPSPTIAKPSGMSACCSITGGKFGQAPYYDWTTTTGQLSGAVPY